MFGEVWSREDKLSLRDLSLITVVALISSGVIDSSLKFHILNAKNNGVSKEEFAEAITHIAFYVGWPKAWAALRMAKEIYEENDDIKPGDIVEIKPGVKHWHGARKDSWFSHLAFEIPGEETSNEWLEQVSDEEYSKLK